ncbi:signal peptidase I [Natronomonas marina]|uniref:signal peptidase I n=1 Tax=Natronomonas marina TaxID=2961939 RepID=UPI0020C97A17|nr:signal peptidase I [Natronomonas marina]
MSTDNTEYGEESDGGGSSLSKRDLLSITATIALIVLVLPFVVYAVPQTVGADQSYVVLSGSMEPAFSPGDVIVVESVPAESISAGDVITFARDGESRPTTHRVIEVVETEAGPAFRTAGDANEDPDPALVQPDQVRGRVPTVDGHLFVLPYIGYVIGFAGTRLGFVALVVTPLILLVLSEAYDLIRSTRGDEEPEPAGSAAGTTHNDERGDAPSKATGPDDGVEGEVPAATPEADEDEAGIVLTPKDLRFSVILLVVFTGYAVWVAYTTREVWSFTAASTVAAALVMIGGLYLFGGSDSVEEPAETVTEPSHGGTVAGPPETRTEPLVDGGIEAVDGPGIPRTAVEPDRPTTAEPERPGGEPSNPNFEDLEPAVVEVEQAADAGEQAADAREQAAEETTWPLARNPLLYPLHAILYAIGYVIVEPVRFVYRRLPFAGGGGRDD